MGKCTLKESLWERAMATEFVETLIGGGRAGPTMSHALSKRGRPRDPGNRAGRYKVAPPSIATSAPVMYPLSSDSRNSTRAATSSAVPRRFIGTASSRR
jgi:hypothetical protein